MSHFDYFPMTIVPWSGAAARLDAGEDAQYVFGVHPHGIHCWLVTQHLLSCRNPEKCPESVTRHASSSRHRAGR
jgi:hypothetical protein